MTEKEKNEIIDLEEFSKEGKKPPRHCRFRIKIDRDKYVVNTPCLTGKELLELAGKVPIEKFALRQKFRGGSVVKVDYDDKVDFTKPGVEKFITIPLDQTDG